MLAIAAAFGLWMGYGLSGSKSDGLAGQWQKVDQILQYVESDYVDTISRKKLEDEVIAYLLQRLDPHSYYINKEDLSAMN
jgi:carboxyl-terminal processing protease